MITILKFQEVLYMRMEIFLLGIVNFFKESYDDAVQQVSSNNVNIKDSKS